MKLHFSRMTFVMVLIFLVSIAAANAANLTMNDLKNAEYYIIDQRKAYKFIDGGASFGMGGVTLYKAAFGELNNDGQKDAAVILEEATGGSAIYYQLAAIIYKNGKLYHAASVMLGDRVGIHKFNIKNGTIIVELTSSPRFKPVKRKVVKYKLVGNKLLGPKAF